MVPKPVDAETDPGKLKAEPEEIAFLVEEEGRPTGYLLNHETVYSSAVNRPVFYCEKNHENWSLGDGTCSHCPFRIVRVEIRGTYR